MPHDQGFGDDEDDKGGGGSPHLKRFKEFDCPSCSANNPYDDGFGNEDAVRCYYCGLEYDVVVTDEGKLKLREA